MLTIDMTHHVAIHAVANELLQASGKRGDQSRSEAKHQVLLLAAPAGHVLHAHAKATLVGHIGAAAVPCAGVQHHNTAFGHLGSDGFVSLAGLEHVGPFV